MQFWSLFMIAYLISFPILLESYVNFNQYDLFITRPWNRLNCSLNSRNPKISGTSLISTVPGTRPSWRRTPTRTWMRTYSGSSASQNSCRHDPVAAMSGSTSPITSNLHAFLYISVNVLNFFFIPSHFNVDFLLCCVFLVCKYALNKLYS